MIKVTRIGVSVAAAVFGVCTVASAEAYIYPRDGQSQEQMTKDKGECHVWAVSESGYDPAQPFVTQQTTQTGAQGGEVVGGAARGAALGAIGGAIAGDAGKGAAIGAGVGGAGGLMRRGGKNQAKAQSQQNNQQAAADANAKGLSSYNRARGACLDARGYTVR